METVEVASPLASLGLLLVVGAAAGYIGSFMVLKRMALVGDALTHVALPGIGIALLLNINPFIGGFAFLTAAVLAITGLQHYTKIYSEALVGLFFTIALAAGILLIPEPELFEALFGDIAEVSILEATVASIAGLIALTVMLLLSRSLLITIIAPDLAKTQKIHAHRTELIFMLLVALIVGLGIRVIGTLLMGALIIIPAITAKNISRSFKHYAILSVILGMASAGIGLFIAITFGIRPGAAVALVGAAFFFLSLPFRRHP